MNASCNAFAYRQGGETMKSMQKKQNKKSHYAVLTLPGTENILGHLQNEQSTFTRKHLPRIPHQVIQINSSIRCTYQIKVNG